MLIIKDFYEMKQQGSKITMMTAYDYPSAKQVQAAGIDMILVGDSLGMTVLGYDGTMQVTLSDMIHHAKAARRGAPDTFIVADMPMGSYGISTEYDLRNAVELYQTTACNAIKLEGNHSELIRQCTAIGIPVIAHLGLMPQSAGLTGYTVQAKTKTAAQQLINTADALAEAGAVMLVLEAVPSDLAAEVTKQIHIPVIGIGAGPDTDGQVLVYHDVLNYATERQPKFVKQYGDYSIGVDALKEFHREVKEHRFPTEEYTYKVKIMDEVKQDADDHNS